MNRYPVWTLIHQRTQPDSSKPKSSTKLLPICILFWYFWVFSFYTNDCLGSSLSQFCPVYCNVFPALLALMASPRQLLCRSHFLFWGSRLTHCFGSASSLCKEALNVAWPNSHCPNNGWVNGFPSRKMFPVLLEEPLAPCSGTDPCLRGTRHCLRGFSAGIRLIMTWLLMMWCSWLSTGSWTHWGLHKKLGMPIALHLSEDKDLTRCI